MLCLRRATTQRIFLDVPPSTEWQRIEVTLCEVKGDSAVLGFDAPKEVEIMRAEIAGRETCQSK